MDSTLTAQIWAISSAIFSGICSVAEEAAEGENAAAKVLEEIAVNRKCIKKGNEYDYSKAAALVIDEFRSGQLGALTLESPEQDA